MQCDLGQISNNSRVAYALLQKLYLKQQIEVPWILLTTQTNFGQSTNAFSLSTQALGQSVRIFCEVVVFSPFTQKTPISSISLLRT